MEPLRPSQGLIGNVTASFVAVGFGASVGGGVGEGADVAVADGVGVGASVGVAGGVAVGASVGEGAGDGVALAAGVGWLGKAAMAGAGVGATGLPQAARDPDSDKMIPTKSA